MKYVLGTLAVSTVFVSLSGFLLTLTDDGWQSASSQVPWPLEPMNQQKTNRKRVQTIKRTDFSGSLRVGNQNVSDDNGLPVHSRNSKTEAPIIRDGDWPDPHPPFPPNKYLTAIPSHILTTEIVFCDECEAVEGCRDLILAQTKGSLAWSVVMNAQQEISGDSSKSCHACDPTMCRPTTPQPLRFDEAAPRFTQRRTFELSTFSREAQRLSKHYPTSEEAWWVYNPSLIPLPDSMKSPNVPEAIYLASLRVSVIPNSSEPWVLDRDHVALTTLDKDFNIMREIVVDPNAQRTRPSLMDDIRLFEYNGTMVLSSALMLLPFQVSMDTGRHSTIFWPIVSGEKSELAVRNEVLPPNGVATRMRHVEDDNVFVYQKKLNKTVKPLMKNVQYFSPVDGEFYAEVYPLTPRRIAKVSSATNQTFLESPEYIMGKYMYYNETRPAAYVVQETSELRRWKFRNDRGSACCIRIEKEHYADLTLDVEVLSQPYIMVGISHLKSFKSLPPDQSFGYLSRIYAFSPLDGLTILATSGLFCLASGKEERYLQYLNDEVYNCPMIHFVTSITISPIDGSKVVIAYGIDDVLATVMETTKRELALHLFSPIPNTELDCCKCPMRRDAVVHANQMGVLFLLLIRSRFQQVVRALASCIREARKFPRIRIKQLSLSRQGKHVVRKLVWNRDRKMAHSVRCAGRSDPSVWSLVGVATTFMTATSPLFGNGVHCVATGLGNSWNPNCDEFSIAIHEAKSLFGKCQANHGRSEPPFLSAPG